MTQQNSTTTEPKIDEEYIRDYVDSRSFEKGRRYFNDGSISDARKSGSTIKACCEGSQPYPYRVSATFDKSGIKEASCSCPVGSGGRCKHVVAMLLEWLHSPGEFRKAESMDTSLEKRSREELIALVKQIVASYPELESLTELPVTGKGKKRAHASTELFRRQAAEAFIHVREGWGAAARIAGSLDAIVERGNDFLRNGDIHAAFAAFSSVGAEVLENYEMFHDEDDGELGTVVQECVEGLGKCLAESASDVSLRKKILEALFDVYHFDVDFGGIDLGNEVPGIIMKHAGKEEREMVAKMVRAVLPPEEGGHDWQRREYGSFLLELEKEDLDDEGFLQVCRETNRLDDMVSRLLKLGRLDEAITEAEKAGDYDLLNLADIFVKHRNGEAAIAIMCKRAETTKDGRVLEWMQAYLMKHDDTRSALDLSKRIFVLKPDISRYRKTRSLAKKLGLWDHAKPAMLEAAKKSGYELLAEIHLDDGEIDQALEAAEKLRHRGYWQSDKELQLKVARAAEKNRPDAAIGIYASLLGDIARARSRESYKEICGYMARLRGLCARTGENKEWESRISTMRSLAQKLPALNDEMRKSGLL